MLTKSIRIRQSTQILELGSIRGHAAIPNRFKPAVAPLGFFIWAKMKSTRLLSHAHVFGTMKLVLYKCLREELFLQAILLIQGFRGRDLSLDVKYETCAFLTHAYTFRAMNLVLQTCLRDELFFQNHSSKLRF